VRRGARENRAFAKASEKSSDDGDDDVAFFFFLLAPDADYFRDSHDARWDARWGGEARA
jgi:hypothetical protein